MLLEPRFAGVLLVLTVGGLVLTASRRNTTPVPRQMSQDIVDLFDDVNNSNNNSYNYCQAQRPTPKTYPTPKVQGSRLVNSQLFVRHGDRTPIAVLPLDLDITWDCANYSAYAFTGIGTDAHDKAPYQRASVVAHQVISIPSGSPFASTHMWKGSCIPGQLTPVGAVQHRRLGAALRHIYVDTLHFLPVTYDPETVYIRSTDLWRTKQSAENLMAGLYGVEGSLPPVLQIHTLPTEIDYLTMNTRACPRISQLRSALEKSSKVLKRLHDNNIDFEKNLSEILGEKKPWSGYLDTILPRVCHGKQLQCRQLGVDSEERCITNESADRILENVGVQTAEVFRDGEGVFQGLQLGIGPLSSEIKQNLLNAKGRSKVRFSLYSGHDTTILPMLGMLDSADLRWPPYASNLLIELWKSPKGEHFVRVLYNHRILETQSDWCDLAWCPLDTFVAHLDRFIVKDISTLCRPH